MFISKKNQDLKKKFHTLLILMMTNYSGVYRNIPVDLKYMKKQKLYSGSNGNEEVLHIYQITRTGALASDGLMLYPGHSLGKSYASPEMQLVHFTASADRAAYN